MEDGVISKKIKGDRFCVFYHYFYLKIFFCVKLHFVPHCFFFKVDEGCFTASYNGLNGNGDGKITYSEADSSTSTNHEVPDGLLLDDTDSNQGKVSGYLLGPELLTSDDQPLQAVLDASEAQ